jgi:hypothetical protein
MEASRIIDRRQKGHGGDSSHAWYGHQAAAGRAFADHLKHHFVKDSALLPKCSARRMGRTIASRCGASTISSTITAIKKWSSFF